MLGNLTNGMFLQGSKSKGGSSSDSSEDERDKRKGRSKEKRRDDRGQKKRFVQILVIGYHVADIFKLF